MGTRGKVDGADACSHETLAQLARDDPQGFEDLRRELIDDLIDGLPEDTQRRLRGLQFRVDAIRRLSHTPLGALMKIQSLMWDSFFRLNQELQRITWRFQGDVVLLEQTQRHTAQPAETGRIIPLERYR